MKLQRRNFLKNIGLGVAGSMVWGAFPRIGGSLAYGDSTNRIKLVKIFLNGGADALGWVPYDLPEVASRRVGLQVPQNNMIDIGHQYVKLVDTLAPLYTNWAANWAIFPGTVAEPNSTGSHDVGRENEAAGACADGVSMMGRMLEQIAQSDSSKYLGWSFVSNDAFHLKAPTYKALTTVSNLANYSYSPYDHPTFGSGQDTTEIRDMAYKMKIASLDAPASMSLAESEVRAAKTGIDASVTAIRIANNAFGTRPVVYPGSTFGTELKSIATLIAAGMGDCFFLRAPGGHDTHSNQLTANNTNQATFAAGLNTFLTDMQMSGQLDNVIVMVIGEFGRQIAVNATLGTDHGAGKCVMLFGGQVNGGLKGGVATVQQVATGVSMPRLIDPRSIYKDIAEKMGFDPAVIVPNSSFVDVEHNLFI